jgi:hypothetical protein
MSTAIETLHCYQLINTDGSPGAILYVLPEDHDDFGKVQPYGYASLGLKCIVADGAVYPLLQTTTGPIQRWTLAALEAEQLALDAEIDALPAGLRAKYGAGHEPWPIRKAKRAADDLEADARALDQAAAAKSAEKKSDSDPEVVAIKDAAEAKRSDAAAKRAEVDALKAVRGIP